MATAEEGQIFVSIRVADFPQPVPGATRGRCHRCGAEVWVSPASRAFFEKAAEVVCHRCQPAEELPLDQVEEPSPQVQAEVDAYLGPPGPGSMPDMRGEGHRQAVHQAEASGGPRA